MEGEGRGAKASPVIFFLAALEKIMPLTGVYGIGERDGYKFIAGACSCSIRAITSIFRPSLVRRVKHLLPSSARLKNVIVARIFCAFFDVFSARSSLVSC